MVGRYLPPNPCCHEEIQITFRYVAWFVANRRTKNDLVMDWVDETEIQEVLPARDLRYGSP